MDNSPSDIIIETSEEEGSAYGSIPANNSYRSEEEQEDEQASINYKELYFKALAEMKELQIKTIDCNSIGGLCNRLSTLLNKEINKHNLFKNLNIRIEEQGWTKEVIKLGKVLNQYFNSFDDHIEKKDDIKEGMVAPQPLLVRFERYMRNEFTQRSKERHVGNINKIIKYKCRNRDYWIEQLQKKCVENWGIKELYLPSLGMLDSDYYQMIADSIDCRWQFLVSELARDLGWNIFTSRRKVRDKRKLDRLWTAQVCRKALQQGKGGGARRSDRALKQRDELMVYFIFYMEEIEAICLGIDSDINGNQFCIPDLITRGWERTIVTQIAGDKQTKYGYSESHCSLTTMKAPMSGQRSIPLVLICGDFADERRSHEQVFQLINDRFGYDKRAVQRGLCDFPVVITLVMFHTEREDDKLSSRLAKSAVAIWDYSMKEECDDIIGVEETLSEPEDVIKLKNSFVSNKYTNNNNNNKKKKNKKKKKKNNKKKIVLWQEAQSIYI